MIHLLDVCAVKQCDNGCIDDETTMVGLILDITKTEYGSVYFLKSADGFGGWYSSRELRKANKAERKALANDLVESYKMVW